MIPEIVAKWINETVLPELSDGYHTAEQIWSETYEECKAQVDSDTAYLFPKDNDALIDAWMMIPKNKQPFIDYVQSVFDSWEEKDG